MLFYLIRGIGGRLGIHVELVLALAEGVELQLLGRNAVPAVGRVKDLLVLLDPQLLLMIPEELEGVVSRHRPPIEQLPQYELIVPTHRQEVVYVWIPSLFRLSGATPSRAGILDVDQPHGVDHVIMPFHRTAFLQLPSEDVVHFESARLVQEAGRDGQVPLGNLL